MESKNDISAILNSFIKMIDEASQTKTSKENIRGGNNEN